MIVSKLMGGLGNQMFQYAAAKSLALKRNTSVKVDDSFLLQKSEGRYTQRNFELSAFSSSIECLSQEEKQQISSQFNIRWKRLLHRFFKFPGGFQYKQEESPYFQNSFFDCGSNVYLSGFWQCEKYFSDIRESLLRDFQFKPEVLDFDISILELISESNSISLHIRRGDYVTLQSASSFHGICSIDYYQNAVSEITLKVKNSVAFVFSDDINWCKENIKLTIPVHFVSTKNAFSDMHLMSKCKHNIIANSSFSWWSAWLNTNKDKIVIAPKQWFAVENEKSRDIVPESWIRL